MEPDRFYDLSLCVSAIVTGSVQRRGPADRRAAEIAVRLQGGRARVELAEREALRIAAPAPPEQMGIALIAGVADRWGVLSGGGRLEWCEIDLLRDLCGPRPAL